MPLTDAPVVAAGQDQLVTLVALAARTADGVGSAVDIGGSFQAITFQLLMTAFADAAGDALTVRVQQQLDGANWDDVVAFATHASGAPGNESQTAFLRKIPRLDDGAVRALRNQT